VDRRQFICLWHFFEDHRLDFFFSYNVKSPNILSPPLYMVLLSSVHLLWIFFKESIQRTRVLDCWNFQKEAKFRLPQSWSQSYFPFFLTWITGWVLRTYPWTSWKAFIATYSQVICLLCNDTCCKKRRKKHSWGIIDRPSLTKTQSCLQGQLACRRVTGFLWGGRHAFCPYVYEVFQ
jgi:hypothetical protein